MINKKATAVLEKIQISLDESLKVLEEAGVSLKAIDVSMIKTQKAIQHATFCVENTQKVLNNYPLFRHRHSGSVFNCAKDGSPHEQMLQQLVLELRYFSYFVGQLNDLDPYYTQLQFHYQNLALNLKKPNPTPALLKKTDE